MGGALAWHDGVFAWTPLTLALLGAFGLQIASNFANDLFDGLRGTDAKGRIGPTRAVGSGLVSPRMMSVALVLALVFAAIPAGFLAIRGGAAFAIIAVVGAVSAVAYTAPPIALAYRGLGDLFVFVFFGPLAVAGTRAACDGSWTTTALVSGVGCGAISVSLLATNNLRDRVTDAASGKRTIAVRCGERCARAQIVLCHMLAIVIPLLLVVSFRVPLTVLAASAVAALGSFASIAIMRGRDGAALNQTLALFGAMLYGYGAAFALGLVLASGAS